MDATRTGLPALNRHALVIADLAWVETDDNPAGRTEAAIRAYLWAVEVGEQDGFYPSLNDWRAAANAPERAESPSQPT